MEKSQESCCLPEKVSINSETCCVMTVTGDCYHLGCDAKQSGAEVSEESAVFIVKVEE